MGKGLSIAKPIVKLSKDGLHFLSKNSNVVLTVISVTGVATTVAMAVRDTVKAVKICEENKVVGTKQIIKTCWKCYIPTIGVAILTTTAIIGNGRINAKKIAVLTSAYSGSLEALNKIEAKMSEQIGPKKTQRAIDDANVDIAKSNIPADQKSIIATGKGTQLFYLRSTGQWFYSDRNGVELAELKTQTDVEKLKACGLDNYYMAREAIENLGITESTEFGEYMGWDVDDFTGNNTIRFIISSDWMDLPWGREVVGVVNFDPWPINV